MPMNYLELPSSPGIYTIMNTANQYFYVGSAVNIRNRTQQHIRHLRNQKHHNPKLQASWNKYGEDAFVFSIVEIVKDRNDLVACEQKWLDFYDVANRDDCYNFLPVAYSSIGRKVTPESRRRMSDAQRIANQSPGRKNIADVTPIEAVWIAHLFAFVVKSNSYLESSPQWETFKRYFQETPDLSR